MDVCGKWLLRWKNAWRQVLAELVLRLFLPNIIGFRDLNLILMEFDPSKLYSLDYLVNFNALPLRGNESPFGIVVGHEVELIEVVKLEEVIV